MRSSCLNLFHNVSRLHVFGWKLTKQNSNSCNSFLAKHDLKAMSVPKWYRSLFPKKDLKQQTRPSNRSNAGQHRKQNKPKCWQSKDMLGNVAAEVATWTKLLNTHQKQEIKNMVRTVHWTPVKCRTIRPMTIRQNVEKFYQPWHVCNHWLLD